MVAVVEKISLDEKLLLYGISYFNYLLRHDYIIKSIGFQIKFETWIRFESRKKKRTIIIGLENDKFEISIIKMGNILQKDERKSNLEIISKSHREKILSELQKYEESNDIKQITKFYSGYFQKNISSIVMGEKWF